MCSGSKRKPSQPGSLMEGKEIGLTKSLSVLLELAAADDLSGFKAAIEEEGCDVDESSLWYGRRIGARKMALEERTPLLIAAMFGSKDVLIYIIKTGLVDVNKACGSDSATALHCAAVGGAPSSAEVVKLLLDNSADPDSVDAFGHRPVDLIAAACNSTSDSRKKMLEALLGGSGADCLDAEVNSGEGHEQREVSTPKVSKDGSEKKEYPIDLTLPDIKNGIYGTDEFRMYTFKVKPCSRAYSHDWTECPFVHPGENARRRDPRKYHYSCVPCPEFRKGSCRQGDNCEYAHGIFECWLHPAQYRTRLCKDETSCARRVCFFAHKPEELRPLYASTGSAVPSPRSYSANGSMLDMGLMSPLALGSPAVIIPPSSTPPMTPTGASSPLGSTMWPNQSTVVPPTLQLPGSRLKSAVNARDMDLDMEFFGLENRRRQHLIDDISALSSPSSWNNQLSRASPFSASVERTGELNRLGSVKPTNLDDLFVSLDPSVIPQLQRLSLDGSQLQSPNGIPMRQATNQQLRSSYPTNLSSSPVRSSPSFSIDQCGATAASVLSSRSGVFSKRSHSFIERSAVNRHTGFSSPVSPATPTGPGSVDWSSPDGKLDWGVRGEELNKLRKSASFGFRSSGSSSLVNAASSMAAATDEPGVTWVQSLVKETPGTGKFGFQEQQQCHRNTDSFEALPAWVEQLYMEQEPMVA